MDYSRLDRLCSQSPDALQQKVQDLESAAARKRNLGGRRTPPSLARGIRMYSLALKRVLEREGNHQPDSED